MDRDYYLFSNVRHKMLDNFAAPMIQLNYKYLTSCSLESLLLLEFSSWVGGCQFCGEECLADISTRCTIDRKGLHIWARGFQCSSEECLTDDST